MKTAENNTCPRCLGPVPDEAHKGQYPGALSRVADVEICSMCGQDEAVGYLFNNKGETGMIATELWPIERADVIRRVGPLSMFQN